MKTIHQLLLTISALGCPASLLKAAEEVPGIIIATSSVFSRISHCHNHVAISPDGKFITLQEESGPYKVGPRHELLVLDGATKKILHRLPRACGFGVEFTPDGTRLICLRLRGGDWNPPRDAPILHDANVFDSKTGKLLRTIPLRGTEFGYYGGEDGIKPFALSDDVLVLRRDVGAQVYSLKTGKELGVLAAGMPLQRASISRDGRWLLTLDSDQNLRVWDVKTRKLARDLPKAPAKVEAVCISPDGKWCASIVLGRQAFIHDRATGRLEASTRLTTHKWIMRSVHAAAFTADGKRLVVTGWEEPVYLPLRPGERRPQIDPDRLDLGLRFWEWRTDKPILRVVSPWGEKMKKEAYSQGSYGSLLMTADGTRFVTSGRPAGVRLLDLKNPNPPPEGKPEKPEEPAPEPKK